MLKEAKAKQTKGAAKTKPKAASVPVRMDAPATLADVSRAMDHFFDDFMKDWRTPSLFRGGERFDPFAAAPALSRVGADLVDVKFDVKEADKAFEITAEVPGIAQDDVEISLEAGVLTIKGEKKEETEETKKDRYVAERRYGSFMRAFRLPPTVDEGKISADYHDGVLTVELPKTAAAKAKAKKIAIGR